MSDLQTMKRDVIGFYEMRIASPLNTSAASWSLSNGCALTPAYRTWKSWQSS